eukprot:981547_1
MGDKFGMAENAIQMQADKLKEPGPLKIPEERQPTRLLRESLSRVHNATCALIDTTKHRSSIAKFGIETVEKLVQSPFVHPATAYTLEKIGSYGEPLLNKVDESIDKLVKSLEVTSEGEESPPSPDPASDYPSFDRAWSVLRAHLVRSEWYQRVDLILERNAVLDLVSKRIVRPAEFFFQSATACFVESVEVDQFLQLLKGKMGEAWDDRLIHFARVYFVTARAAQRICGAGHFFGGVLQLGRQKCTVVLTELSDRFDRVLVLSDNTLQSYFPDSQLRAYLGTVSTQIQSDGAEEREKIGDSEMQPLIEFEGRIPDERVPFELKEGVMAHTTDLVKADVPKVIAFEELKEADSNTMATEEGTLPNAEQVSANPKFHVVSVADCVSPERAYEAGIRSDNLRNSTEPQINTDSMSAMAMIKSDCDLATVSETDAVSLMDIEPDCGAVKRPLVLASGDESDECGRRTRPRLDGEGAVDALKERLLQIDWFEKANDVLLDSPIFKNYPEAPGVKPAKFFFETLTKVLSDIDMEVAIPTEAIPKCMQQTEAEDMKCGVPGGKSCSRPTDKSCTRSTGHSGPKAVSVRDKFVSGVKSKLGRSWDDRLTQTVMLFFSEAWDTTMC